MKSIEEINNIMAEIEYGYVDINGTKHTKIENGTPNYILQPPQNLLNSKLGVCWDQVELERYLFDQYNDIKTYFIVYHDNENNQHHTHTFLTYKENNKYFWYEHSWNIHKGLHKYNTLEELLKDVTKKQISYWKILGIKNINHLNRLMFEYQKPKYNITAQEFFNHCTTGKTIKISIEGE